MGADSKAENGLVTGDAVSLEDGQEAQGGDIALVSSARLEVTVFSDANGDGKRGEYDRGMSGISVEVMDGESALCSRRDPAARARRRSMCAPAPSSCA